MRFVTQPRFEWEGWGESSLVIVTMGLALAIAGTVQTLTVPATQPAVALEVFVSLLVPTGLATGGYWLANRNVCPDVRWRVAIRVSLGIVVACGLGIWLVGYATLEGGTIGDSLSLVTTLAAVGGATGFVTGVRTTPQITPVSPTTANGGSLEESSELDGDSTRGDTDETEAGDDTEADDDTRADDHTTADTRVRTEPAASIKHVEFDGTARRGPSESSLEPSVDRVASIPATVEAVLEVLRDDRARITLAYLYHDCADEPQSIADLARVVADRTDESVGAATVSLRHSTLPRLRAIRAIEWDPYADRLAASDHAVFEEGVRETAAVLESFEPGTR